MKSDDPEVDPNAPLAGIGFLIKRLMPSIKIALWVIVIIAALTIGLVVLLSNHPS